MINNPDEANNAISFLNLFFLNNIHNKQNNIL
jgi:hypothetical protein